MEKAGPPRIRFGIALKVVLWFSFITLVLSAIVLYREWRQFDAEVQATVGERVRHIAATAAMFLDGTAHETIRTNEDKGSDNYVRLQSLLRKVQTENQLQEYDVYTLRRDADGGFEFVLNLRETPMVETSYDPPPTVKLIVEQVWKSGVAASTPMYNDQYGSFVSAFAPIRDASGKIVALLEIDTDVDLVVEALQARLKEHGALFVITLAIASLLSLMLTLRSLTSPILRLVKAMGEVESGRFDIEVPVSSSDEIGVLSGGFNSMLRGLRERLAMLRFVPKHTRAVIAASTHGRSAMEGDYATRQQDLAVFFSDIRGFTALSDELPPDRIIAMLNIYMREETEIVERHGGSIDKFIGDAVMAIFEGPDRFIHAAEAALEVQEKLTRLSDQKAFERPVHVGIGIAGGEIVMGGVGTEERMELAVIGRYVNLASRLTSVAKGGEIMISELAYQAIGDRFVTESRDRVKLKGFAEEQACYRLVARADARSEAAGS